MSIKWWNCQSAPLYLYEKNNDELVFEVKCAPLQETPKTQEKKRQNQQKEQVVQGEKKIPATFSKNDTIFDVFAKLLKSLGVQLVSFDFDNTLVVSPDPENKKKIKEDAVAIARYRQRITPLFEKLVKALRKQGIYVSICTYNTSRRLKMAFDNIHNDGIVLPVYARNDTRVGTGKIWHLMQSMQSLNNHLRKKLKDQFSPLRPCHVLLFDDLKENGDTADHMGFHFIHNKSVITEQDLHDFVNSKK